MKKRLFTIATAVACMMGFASCDMDLEDLLNDEELNLTGHITLYSSNPTAGELGNVQEYGNGDTLRFKSAACNLTEATPGFETGTMIVATHDNLITNNNEANLSFPLAGINLRGTSAQNYTVNCPVHDFGFFEYLSNTDVNLLITQGIMYSNYLGSLFAIAVDSNSYYLGYQGNINITSFGEDGDLVEGTVNINALYVTKDEVERIANDPDYRSTISDISTHFPSITFTGEISSRRVPIQMVIDALEENN